jgi:hypothetical protein
MPTFRQRQHPQLDNPTYSQTYQPSLYGDEVDLLKARVRQLEDENMKLEAERNSIQ